MDSPRRAGRHSSTRGPSVPKDKLAGTIAILAFGLTSLFAVLNVETLVGVTFVLGFFVLLPLVGILGDDLPYVYDEDEAESAEETRQSGDPVARLRERYARGDIDEAEFERRLDALLETEELEGVVDGASAGRDRDRETELE